MNIEERSKQIIKRADAYDAGYAKGLKDGRVQSEYFAVIRTCKDDMIEEFEASPKIQLEIEQFTKEQMASIADNMGMLIIDTYWQILREAVERELNR